MPKLLTPPHSLEAEQALIAACIVNPEIIPAVIHRLQPEDFYKIAHEHITRAMVHLKKNADLVLIYQHMVDKGVAEEAGGKKYLMTLVNASASSAGWAYYATIIKEKAQRRRIMALASVAMGQTQDDAQYALEEILSFLKTGIRDIQQESLPDHRSQADILQAVYKDIEKRSENHNYFVGIETGLRAIDKKLSGLEPKTTIYIAARPSMGKTSLALNIATNVALAHPEEQVLYFNLESNAESLIRRQLAFMSGIFLTRIRRGQIADNEWDCLTQAFINLSAGSALSILDNSKFRLIENIVSYAETIAMDHKISLIVVDHIQKMTTRKRFNNRHLEISHVSNALQDLAKDLAVPILVLCQLNREAEGRSNSRPTLRDLKESGDLEQNADIVWGLWREDKLAEITEVNQLKGRDTGTYQITLKFDPKTQRFTDPPIEWEDPEPNYWDK